MPNKNSLKELKIEIGDIVFSAVSKDSDLRLEADARYKQFISSSMPDVVLSAHYGNLRRQKVGERIFDSGDYWSLFRSDGKLIFCLFSYPFNAVPDRIAVLESNYKSIDIYFKKKPEIPSITNPTINPFQYPLDELLMINLMSSGLGVLIHACGIRIKDRGIIFPGTSGAGKSTLANLGKSKKDFTILSDDRIIIRKIDGRFWIYGTPWHGDAQVCSPERAPLERIFFLNHALENWAKGIERIDATSKLMVRSFPPFWSKEGMEFTLGFIDELTKEVPCYELGFLPDKSVFDLIKSI
jgi:hypothetical protein